MNIANKLTVMRLLLIPVFIATLLIFQLDNYLAVSIFIIASITDFLDGYLARSRNLVTTFGKFLDPLADKMLVTTAMIMLIGLEKIPSWIVVIVVAREFIITGFRVLAASEGITIAASPFGKFKTITQFLALILIMTNNTFIVKLAIPLDQILLYISLFFTIVSAVDYIQKNIQVLDMKNL